MAPAAEPRRRDHEEQTERREPDAGADGMHLAYDRGEPPGADRDDGVGDPRVEPVERARIGAEPQAAGDDDGREGHQPDPACETDLLGQRRGSARRPTASVHGVLRTCRRLECLVRLFHGFPPPHDPCTISQAPGRAAELRSAFDGPDPRVASSTPSGYDGTVERSPGLPTSAACVASLVLGVLSILFAALGYPAFVAGASAVVFGIIGIRRANRGMVSGRGLAVAGVVLGAVGSV